MPILLLCLCAYFQMNHNYITKILSKLIIINTLIHIPQHFGLK